MTSANKNERNVPPSVVGCGFVRNKFARVDPFVLLENTQRASRGSIIRVRFPRRKVG